MSDVLLRIRSSLNQHFLTNHHLGGWKVRDADNRNWIDMTTANTKVLNPDFNDMLPESESNPRWLNTRGL